MSDLVQCVQAFSFHADGAPHVVSVGDIFDSSDPVLKGREGLFAEVYVRSTVTNARKKTASEVGSEKPVEETRRRRSAPRTTEPEASEV